jgi:hypothetical protein
MVRTLIDEPTLAGRRAVPWDGRDDGGHPVAGGVYFARLESAGESAVRKLVRLGR